VSRHVTVATWDDVPHLSKKQKDELWQAFPEHEREARAKGVPMLGSGRVFQVSEESITCDAAPIARHWTQIVGIDFGIDHPFAAAHLAWDRDADILYVTKTYRQRGAVPAIHAAAIKPWGKWVPIAWPHDGLIRDKGSGDQLAKQYRDQGLSMLVDRAEHEEGGIGVEAGLYEILERMQTGRFKVFRSNAEWLEEFRFYHRKDGVLIKERDDLMSATRYAVMMKRFSTTEPASKPLQYKAKKYA
jgi:hypothetical protein